MNWYKITKFAAAKSKISMLKITEPCDMAFVYKYEGVMPWNEIKDLTQFETYVEKLKSSLYTRINSIKSEESQTILYDWVNHMGEWSELSDSCFFLIMDPIIKFAEKHEASPIYIMPQVAEEILNKIMANPTKPFDILKEYLKKATPIPKTNGWHEFTREKNTAEELALFTQGTGWCISQPNFAEDYLENHSVYIYVENQKPVAAAITSIEYENEDDDDGKEVLIEVRGLSNSIPYKYKNDIDALIRKNNMEVYRDSYTYRLLKGMPQVNALLNKNQNSKEAISLFKKLLDAMSYNLAAYAGLEEKNQKNRFIREVMKEVMDTKIKEDAPNVSNFWNGVVPQIRRDFKNDFIKILQKQIESGEAISPIGLSSDIAALLNFDKINQNFRKKFLEGGLAMWALNPETSTMISDEEFAQYMTFRYSLTGLMENEDLKNAVGKERAERILMLAREKVIANLKEKLKKGHNILSVLNNAFLYSSSSARTFLVKTLGDDIKNYIEKEIYSFFKPLSQNDNFDDYIVSIPREFEEYAESILNKIRATNPNNNKVDEISISTF